MPNVFMAFSIRIVSAVNAAKLAAVVLFNRLRPVKLNVLVVITDMGPRGTDR
jgi:hypothetical protein